jgi:uncharacterized protein YlxW (UPF0749 family)
MHLGKPWWLSGWSAVVPVVAIAAGLLFATSAQTSGGTDLRSSGRSDLVDVVRDQDRAVRERAAVVARLQGEVDALTAKAAPGSAEVARLRAQALRLAAGSGAQAVSGPALSVTLNDSKLSPENLPEGMTADDLVVHQGDVQNVVNAMWAGGAEAMMLQDQRVISTSAVRCVGNTLILQGRVYSPPYVIKAIGDVSAMHASLDGDHEINIYKQYVDEVGLGFEEKGFDKSVFPAFAGSLSLQNAKIS